MSKYRILFLILLGLSLNHFAWAENASPNDVPLPAELKQYCTYLGNGFGASGSRLLTKNNEDLSIYWVNLSYQCLSAIDSSEPDAEGGPSSKKDSRLDKILSDYARRVVYRNIHDTGACEVITSNGSRALLTERPGAEKPWEYPSGHILLNYNASFSCKAKKP